MKTITLVLASAASLLLCNCAGTKPCATCCATPSAAPMKACCKAAAAKGMKCEKCAAAMKMGKDMKAM